MFTRMSVVTSDHIDGERREREAGRESEVPVEKGSDHGTELRALVPYGHSRQKSDPQDDDDRREDEDQFAVRRKTDMVQQDERHHKPRRGEVMGVIDRSLEELGVEHQRDRQGVEHDEPGPHPGPCDTEQNRQRGSRADDEIGDYHGGLDGRAVIGPEHVVADQDRERDEAEQFDP